MYCFALQNSTEKIEAIGGTSVKDVSRLVGKFGGKSSQDAVLLSDGSEDECIKKDHNSKNRKCTLVHIALMSYETWCQLCSVTNREELMKLVDEETPSGVFTQSSHTDQLESTRNVAETMASAIDNLNISAIPPTAAQSAAQSSTEPSGYGTRASNPTTISSNSLTASQDSSISTDSQLHCQPCNRSFKTKGGLGKHRTSKLCKSQQ